MDGPKLKLNYREAATPAETNVARGWRGVSVEFSRLRLPSEYTFDWDGRSHYVAYHDLVLLDGEMEILGETPVSGRDLRDKMTYVPAGRTIEGWAKPVERMNSFTVVYFDPNVMESELQLALSTGDATPKTYFSHIELGSTMRKLARIMSSEEGGAVTKVLAETLGLAAALEMFQVITDLKGKVPCQERLSRPQANSVEQYIEAHLANDIGLDDLAAVCGLTRFHFCRAFKGSFGEPPYRYVTRRRIERAKSMLTSSNLPVSEIAVACGFNGASQFGRAFREGVGTAPLQFRRRT